MVESDKAMCVCVCVCVCETNGVPATIVHLKLALCGRQPAHRLPDAIAIGKRKFAVKFWLSILLSNVVLRNSHQLVADPGHFILFLSLFFQS